MIIKVANPIYDSVFKYLMEDERIAKTILSALLKKEVVSVKIRRNEYSNGTRNNISRRSLILPCLEHGSVSRIWCLDGT